MKISKLFSVFALVLIILILTTTTVFAATPVKGEGSYSYDYVSGCVHYIGTNSWKWQNVGTATKGSYTWSGRDAYVMYNVCDGGTYLGKGGWSYAGHALMRNGETFVMTDHVQDRQHMYKYLWVSVDGVIKVNAYWYDGIKRS